jgi:hypothetical protein
MLHTRTALAAGVRELFRQLEDRLSLRSPVNFRNAIALARQIETERNGSYGFKGF